MKEKILIFIPVYNEEENVILIVKNIFRKFKKNIDILFVEDNSKDNTQKNILNMKKKFNNIFLIKRKEKLGIGSAHKVGIRWAIRKKYDLLVTMDCDGTHDPFYIKKIILNLKINKSHISITNRFLKKNSLKDWSNWRIILTKIRHLLIRKILKIDYDSSGAFRCYDLKKIKLKDIMLAHDNGYSFFWESIYKLNKLNYKITEIPIKLPGRLMGNSKMRIYDILRAFFYLIKISTSKI